MAVILGTGAHRYEVVSDWAKLPPGQEFNADVAAVGVDAQDRVYAFNRGKHPMVVFDRDGSFLRSWGEGVLRRAHGVHMAPDETLWLTDDGDHTVRHCTLDGKVLLTLGLPGKPTAYMSGEPFHRCTHTALSPQGELYVSDGYGNARVHKYSPDGKLLRRGASPAPIPASSISPTTSPATRTAGCTWRIARITASRSSTATGGTRPSGTTCTGPRGCTSSPAERRASTSARSAAAWRSTSDMPNIGPRVSIYTAKGELLARLGDRPAGLEPGQFVSPHGLAVDSRGDIYVGEVSYTNWGRRWASHPARSAQPAEARQGTLREGGPMTEPVTMRIFSDYV